MNAQREVGLKDFFEMRYSVEALYRQLGLIPPNPTRFAEHTAIYSRLRSDPLDFLFEEA